METSSIKTPFPGRVSVPSSFVSLFIFYILSYLLSKTMGCFSGCLMCSASDQKLLCEVCSVFSCSFDEFVGEKVVSPSYSSAILAPGSEQFYEDLQDLLELTPKKDVLFIIGDWNAKVGSQETPGVKGKFSLGVQNTAGQRLIVLPRICTGYSKHPLPTTQEKTLHMDITRWSTLKSD